MKIFLNDRVILLLAVLPEKRQPEDVFFEFHDRSQLKQLYKNFEKDETVKQLVIYTEQDFTTLHHAFFSLFTVVEAAGGRVVNERGELLVIFRYGKWDLPKGKIVHREEPEEAAVREVSEETGLQRMKVGKPLSSTYHIFRNNGIRILKQTYWFEMMAESRQLLVPQLEEDISVARWAIEEELSQLLENTYASLMDVFNGTGSETVD